MKKTGKKSKLMVGLVVGVATMICGFVAYAATGIVKTDNKLDLKFVNFKSTVKNNQVSSTDWDELMDTLESLKAKVAALEAESDIPSGAIMAFDSATGCPIGWTEYSKAEGRFLMGVEKSKVGMTSGASNNEIMLQATQLPDHQHFIRFGGKAKYGDNANTRSVVVDWDSAGFPRDAEIIDNQKVIYDMENYAYSKYDVLTAPYGKFDRVRDKATHEELQYRGWGSWDGNKIDPINITNAYVGVIFCKKD